MDQREIEAIFKEKIAIIKQYSNKTVRPVKSFVDYDVTKERERIPPLNPIYRQSVIYRDMIKVHSDIDNKPVDLMRRRAPFEDDRQYEYRVRNFENVTMPPFMKALSKLNRIFNPSNFSVQWTSDQQAEKKYFEEEIPIFGNFLSYFEEIVLTKKILDPNALAVVKPYYIPTKEDQDEKGNPILVFDDSEPIKSTCCVIDCEKVIDYKEGVFALIMLEEKSLVRVGEKDKREGLIFEIYDQENIYRIEQYGEKTKWLFTEPRIYYPHNLGYMPAWKLKGIPIQKDLDVLFQSYFIYAIPNLNIALYAHSNLDISLVTHMFPQKVEYVDRCPEAGCDNGTYRWENEQGQTQSRACSACNGSGKMTKTGPMMTKQLTIPDRMQGDDDINAVEAPGVWYVAPNPDVPEFVWKKYLQDVVDAFMFLNMDVSNSDVKGSETALGKQIDREELFAMLMRISNEIFALYDKAQKAAGQMRFGTEFKNPVISAPTSFSIRSEQDLLEELTEAKKAGVPDVALAEIVKEYIGKRYSSRANIHKIINLAFSIDRLIVKIQVETSAMQAAGTASKLEVILHDSFFTFIDQISLEDPQFWEKDFKAQSELLWAKAQAIYDMIEKARQKENAVVTDKILEIANNDAA